MKESMFAGAATAEKPSRNLQKEFDALRRGKGGDVEALGFLVENYERNPHFAEKKALEMSVGLNERMAGTLLRSSATELRARLYAEFNALSERQKTKISGFRNFVEGFVARMLGESDEVSPQQQRFNQLLLEDLDRYQEPVEGSKIYQEMWRTKRVNYREVTDKNQEYLNTLYAKFELIGKILAKSPAVAI